MAALDHRDLFPLSAATLAGAAASSNHVRGALHDHKRHQELEHWTGDDPSDSVFEPAIERTLQGLDDRLRRIRDGDEVVSGIRSLSTPGHTPGHLALAIGYHFPFPSVGYAFLSGDAYRWHPAGWGVLS